MDEILIREYLRNKERGMSDSDFMERMKDYYGSEEYSRGGRVRRNSRREDFYFEPNDRHGWDNPYTRRHRGNMDDFMEEMRHMSHEDRKRMKEMMYGMEGEEHFTDSHARHIVSKMYHVENGRKYVGEKFDMMRAKEIYDVYKGTIHNEVTVADVYVAINAQYHDYCELFKSWFGESIDNRVVESAIKFWFKDDDWKDSNKIYEYFEEA